jgi:hypothetical protein
MAQNQAEKDRLATVQHPDRYRPPEVLELGRLTDLTNGPNYGGELGPRPHRTL